MSDKQQEGNSMLSAVWGDARDITDSLRATELLKTLNDHGILTNYEILGSNYHPQWLENINNAFASSRSYPNEDPADLIDPNIEGQRIYAISLNSGLMPALEHWWNIDAASLTAPHAAQELIGKWQEMNFTVPKSYRQSGWILIPSGATLAFNDQIPNGRQNNPTTLLISAPGWMRSVEYPLLGLDEKDKTAGPQAFLKSLTDPSITRRTYIQQEARYHQQNQIR